MSEVTVKQASSMGRLSERVWASDLVRFLKFGVVGGSGVFVNLGVMWLSLNYLFISLPEPWLARMSSLNGIAFSVVSNFVLNDLWTWADRTKMRSWRARLVQYAMTTSVGVLVQFGSMEVLTRWGMHPMLAQSVGIGLGLVLNYTVLNKWTFRAQPAVVGVNAEPVPPLAEIEDAFK